MIRFAVLSEATLMEIPLSHFRMTERSPMTICGWPFLLNAGVPYRTIEVRDSNSGNVVAWIRLKPIVMEPK